MKSFKVLSVLLLLSIITEIISEKMKCDIKLGCLMRVKYFSHVSVQTKIGKAAPLKSSINYKIIYVYNDRLVFYSSRRATDISLEFENDKTKLVDEMNIERIINFSNIILDCGKYHNRICFAQNYPNIEGVPFFKKLKEFITTSPEIKCIVVPFFENSYKFSHEKLAFICIHETRQLKQLIDFKNIISRAIENNQMKLADDRFNSFNGLKKDQEKFILFKNNKAMQVIGKLFGNKISIVTNDKSTDHVMDYSLYQVRINGVHFGNEALRKKLIKPDWNKNFEWKTHPECCLVFPGGKYYLN
jgi:hypothetical protein